MIFKMRFCSLCVDQGYAMQLHLGNHAVPFWLSEMVMVKVSSGVLAIFHLSKNHYNSKVYT